MRRSTALRIAREVYGSPVPDIRLSAELRRLNYDGYTASLRTRKAYHLIVEEWRVLYRAAHPRGNMGPRHRV